MKKKIMMIMLLLAAITTGSVKADAQATEIAQLAVDIQKLAQLKKILQNMYSAYTIISQGYNRVKDITSGNYSLHEAFVDGLLLVNPNLRKYQRVADIIRDQAYILAEYKQAFGRFKQSNLFDPQELEYMANLYSSLFQRSLEDIDELTMVLTNSSLRMSDDERITTIDRLYIDMQQMLSFLRSFNKNTSTVMRQRQLSRGSVDLVRKLNGLTR